jgi:uncharacterized membrane protein YbhN (UPF0104 family)
MYKKILKVLGNILTIMAIAYIILNITKSDFSSLRQLELKDYLIIFVALFIQCVIVFFSSTPWLIITRYITGVKISYLKTISVFLYANVLKYLPGNVFHYVGRNKLAIDYSLKNADVALATVIDIILGLGSGFLFSTFFFKDRFKDFVNANIIFALVVIVCLSFVIIKVLLIKKVNVIVRIHEDILKFISVKGGFTVLLSIIYYLIQNIFTVITVMVVSYVIIGRLSIYDLGILGCGYIFASIIGTITPGAPAGVGVRETVMLAICTNIKIEQVTVILIILRIISIIADIFNFVISKIIDMVEN